MKKKLISLVLALCMVLALCACGGPKITEADFEGTWKAQIDVTGSVAENFSQEELDEICEGIDSSQFIRVSDLKIPPITIEMQLNADKTFTMGLADDSTKIIADAVVAWFTAADFEGLFTALFTKECEDYGMTLDDMMTMFGAESVTEMIEMLFEMPLDEYVAQFAEELTEDAESDFDLEEFTESGTWAFNTDKVVLTSDDTADELAFNQDAFTLTESVEGYGEVVFSR